jgi:hypothetical protein
MLRIGSIVALLVAMATPAESRLACGSSACGDDALVADVRAAVRDACPCGGAASAKAHRKCWKPVVKQLVKSRGASGFPKACRAEVTRALANSTCGRKGTVLCRKQTKKKSETCRVTEASKCPAPVDTGEFGSCADVCDRTTAEPFPTTTELAAADVAAIDSDEGGVIRFAAAPASLAGVDVGSVLVGGIGPKTPAGLLRVVLAVEHDGDALLLRTAQAPVQLAYKKLHVRFVRSLLATPSTAASTLVPRAAVEATKPFDFTLFDGDGSDVTTNDRIAVDGMIGGGFDFDFALDVDWGAIDSLPDVVTNCLKALVGILTGDPASCSIDDLLPEAKVTFVVLPEVKADANVHGAAILSYEKQVDLASETLTPIVVGPLVFVPVADITAELSGGASGQFSTGVHGSAQFETSVTVSSRQTDAPKFKQPVLRSTDFGPNDTSVTLHAEAKIGVGSRLSLLLAGVTGPYAEARAYASIAGDVQDTPCWSLHTGVDANLGVRVTSPALPVIGEVVLVDWRAPTVNPLDIELATGVCDAPPDGSTLPPGGGPDAMHLANPTYVPWSRTFTSPVHTYGVGTGNSSNYVDLQRTIDGHYVHSGWLGKSVVKLDENGAIVWARKLQLADETKVDPLHVRSSTDASLLVVSAPIGAPLLLTHLAQDGPVIDARAYDPPSEACGIDPKGLASDGAGGAWVTGPCVGGTSHGFLLHAEPDRTSFWLLDQDFLHMKIVEAIGRDAFLAGQGAFEGALVAARMTPEGTLVYSKRYDACAAAPDAIPSQALVGPQGEVTIAGSGGAEHNGTFVRILPDGSLGFATFPGFGFGVGSVFLLDSLAELPTTGYVAGATHVRFNGLEPDETDSPGLVGLDAAGHIRWAMRYSFGAPGGYVRSGPTAVHLSDDGGVFVTAVLDTGDPADFDAGRIWAFKPFAKDGTIDFVPGTAVALPLGISELDCSMTASDFPIQLTPVDVPTRSVSVVSVPVTLDVAGQTVQ